MIEPALAVDDTTRVGVAFSSVSHPQTAAVLIMPTTPREPPPAPAMPNERATGALSRSGVALRCIPRFDAPSPPKGIREDFMSWGEALVWGTVIVAVAFAVLGAVYFLIQSFVSG
jgi:hypothetical protein